MTIPVNPRYYADYLYHHRNLCVGCSRRKYEKTLNPYSYSKYRGAPLNEENSNLFVRYIPMTFADFNFGKTDEDRELVYDGRRYGVSQQPPCSYICGVKSPLNPALNETSKHVLVHECGSSDVVWFRFDEVDGFEDAWNRMNLDFTRVISRLTSFKSKRVEREVKSGAKDIEAKVHESHYGDRCICVDLEGDGYTVQIAGVGRVVIVTLPTTVDTKRTTRCPHGLANFLCDMGLTLVGQGIDGDVPKMTRLVEDCLFPRDAVKQKEYAHAMNNGRMRMTMDWGGANKNFSLCVRSSLLVCPEEVKKDDLSYSGTMYKETFDMKNAKDRVAKAHRDAVLNCDEGDEQRYFMKKMHLVLTNASTDSAEYSCAKELSLSKVFQIFAHMGKPGPIPKRVQFYYVGEIKLMIDSIMMRDYLDIDVNLCEASLRKLVKPEYLGSPQPPPPPQPPQHTPQPVLCPVRPDIVGGFGDALSTRVGGLGDASSARKSWLNRSEALGLLAFLVSGFANVTEAGTKHLRYRRFFTAVKEHASAIATTVKGKLSCTHKYSELLSF